MWRNPKMQDKGKPYQWACSWRPWEWSAPATTSAAAACASQTTQCTWSRPPAYSPPAACAHSPPSPPSWCGWWPSSPRRASARAPRSPRHCCRCGGAPASPRTPRSRRTRWPAGKPWLRAGGDVPRAPRWGIGRLAWVRVRVRARPREGLKSKREARRDATLAVDNVRAGARRGERRGSVRCRSLSMTRVWAALRRAYPSPSLQGIWGSVEVTPSLQGHVESPWILHLMSKSRILCVHLLWFFNAVSLVVFSCTGGVFKHRCSANWEILSLQFGECIGGGLMHRCEALIHDTLFTLPGDDNLDSP